MSTGSQIDAPAWSLQQPSVASGRDSGGLLCHQKTVTWTRGRAGRSITPPRHYNDVIARRACALCYAPTLLGYVACTLVDHSPELYK